MGKGQRHPINDDAYIGSVLPLYCAALCNRPQRIEAQCNGMEWLVSRDPGPGRAATGWGRRHLQAFPPLPGIRFAGFRAVKVIAAWSPRSSD
jgi:hypothetical protein